MSEQQIDAALRDATDTETVTIGRDVLASVADVFASSFAEQPAVIVADENTFAVAGQEVHQRLQAAGRALQEPYVFSRQPTLYAEYGNIEKLVSALRVHNAIPIAVGSGTINDIVKRAAHECNRHYLCVGTAASMDGYTSFGASIAKDGYKQTLTCPAPRAVLADVKLLTDAPSSMTASGYADLLAKITAGADWLVADALEVETINSQVWSLVQEPLREATGRPAELSAGDPDAMEALIEGLIMSGLAMQAAASSRPASGAEHQFSHLWEMEGLGHDDDPPLSHGFKVGVGTLAIAALYERVLECDLTDIDVDAIRAAWPSREEVEPAVRAEHTTPGLDDAAVEESLAKYSDADELAQRLALLGKCWPRLRERLREQLLSADQLREMLQAAGCPTHPSQIGLDMAAFKATYRRAGMIRRRYTILDMATEAGILEKCVEEVFAPGGFWADERGRQA